ncbi:hypothetical protein F4778DRAFT_288878 [Xylariomycetidae sp. FL2044]|nr:hypothetical protein F4778DRAFT_710450 [Xylariomycetidae sp. FL2044]KAH9894717.1 hypothetical protein F4778DRAFT_288878 [Xylariomycetidae sp. FL2044]
MKLQSFLLPAAAGLVTAKTADPNVAEAYIIRQSHTTASSKTPSLDRDLAEAILLHRLSSTQSSRLGQLPDSFQRDEAISFINQFGKPSTPLFADPASNDPSQLLITFSGVTSESHEQVKAALASVPQAFTAAGLSHIPLDGKSSCTFVPSTDPNEAGCWKGKSQYLHYDLSKSRDVVQQLAESLASLQSRALAGDMETTIVILATRGPEFDDELRRRDLKEAVFSSDEFASSSTAKPSSPDANMESDDFFHVFQDSSRPAAIPSCFASQSACAAATNDCSGHGECVDRFQGSDDSCFFCYCIPTVDMVNGTAKNTTSRWGGSMCQKRDVSTPFWMFAGVSLTLVGTIAFAISLLFSVGEEKLPGVIGAGVSRSSK